LSLTRRKFSQFGKNAQIRIFRDTLQRTVMLFWSQRVHRVLCW